MEMIRDCLTPEMLARMRKIFEAEERPMVPQATRIKRDFEEEADRAAYEKRRRARAATSD